MTVFLFLSIQLLMCCKSRVISLIKNQRDQIQNFGVKRLGLFGSFVCEEQNDKSDVDLLVEFEQGQKTFNNFIHLCFFWKNCLNERLNC